MGRRLVLLAATVALTWSAAAAGLGAVPLQGGPGGRPGRGRQGPPPAPNPAIMTPAEVDQYFDNVVLYQAQGQLQLSDDQVFRFGARLRQLQGLRRQQQARRGAFVRDLNNLLAAAPLDESAVTAKIKELDDAMDGFDRQIRDAYTALDETLTVRQRARFRVFEEQMERRRVDLIARARQQAGRGGPAANAPVNPPAGGPQVR